jgi:hypothetical protein
MTETPAIASALGLGIASAPDAVQRALASNIFQNTASSIVPVTSFFKLRFFVSLRLCVKKYQNCETKPIFNASNCHPERNKQTHFGNKSNL